MAILVAVGGEVFDVTPGAAFYTRGASYAAFAGRAATRAIATASSAAGSCGRSSEIREAAAAWRRRRH